MFLKKSDLNVKSRQTSENRLFETRLVRFARMQTRPGSTNVEAHFLNKKLIKLCNSRISSLWHPCCENSLFRRVFIGPSTPLASSSQGSELIALDRETKIKMTRLRRTPGEGGLCGGCAGILQPNGGSMIWSQSHFGNIHISICPYPHSPCFVGRRHA